MGISSKLFGRRKATLERQRAQQAFEPFITTIIDKRGEHGRCLLKFAQYCDLREALRARLQERGLSDDQMLAVLRGRLVGICPTCRLRLGVEYLDWLCTGENAVDFAGHSARERARFGEGKCVNAECSGTDIELCWQP